MTTKTIPIDQAVGMVLPHDITEIRQEDARNKDSGFKGPAFRKGHIIRYEDIDHLRRLGKEHIYVLNLGPNDIHENEAAKLLADGLAAGQQQRLQLGCPQPLELLDSGGYGNLALRGLALLEGAR